MTSLVRLPNQWNLNLKKKLYIGNKALLMVYKGMILKEGKKTHAIEKNDVFGNGTCWEKKKKQKNRKMTAMTMTIMITMKEEKKKSKKDKENENTKNTNRKKKTPVKNKQKTMEVNKK